MLLNQDDVPAVSQCMLGQTQVTLTEVQLGHALGLMFIMPRERGNPVRMVVNQPRGITDYVQRAKEGQDLKNFMVFTRGRTIHAYPIQSGATHAYFNFSNLGSAPAALILLLAGLGKRINWTRVDPEEMLVEARSPEEVWKFMESLLLPEELHLVDAAVAV